MNSVPPEERGVASGMISTLRNTAGTASMGIFFTIIIVGITQRFPAAMTASLVNIGRNPSGPNTKQYSTHSCIVLGIFRI